MLPSLLTLGLGGGSAHAQTAPTASPGAESAASRVVVLFVPDLAARDDDDILAATIRAQVDPGSVDLRLLRYDDATVRARGAIARRSRAAAEEYAATGVMWIRLAEGSSPHAVFFYDASTDRVLGRRVPQDAEAPAAALEAVSNIAGSVVAEVGTGVTAALTEVDPETLEETPPDPEPEPPPETETETETETEPDTRRPSDAAPPPRDAFARLWLMAAYAGNTFADVAPWQHAVAFAAAWSPAPGAFVGLRYDVVVPTNLETAGIAVSIRRHPIALEGGYRFPVAPRLDVEVFGRVAVDPTTRRSGTGGTEAALRIFSSAAAGVGLGYAPIRQVRLGLRVGAELLTSRASYVTDDGISRSVAVSPHPARFLAEAGLHFGLLWRSRRSPNAASGSAPR